MHLIPFLLIALSAQPDVTTPSWIDSAQAYFATNAERVEWGRLTTDDERARFIERYWLKRDPTPGTAKNEFHDAILERIARADAKYKFDVTRGSETARGFVFVVFGPPARFRTATSGPARAARTDIPDTPLGPGGTLEVGESYEMWIYDRERTPRLLDMVGLPSLTFNFVIRPQKHIDELQSPGLAYELRDKLAARSIVNPNAGLANAAAVPPAAVARLDAALPEKVARGLDDAPPPSFASPAGYFGASTRWSAEGQPRVVVWFSATPQMKSFADSVRFAGRIARGDGSTAATFSEPLRATTALRSSGGGTVYALTFALPAGDYNGAFALADATGDVVAQASMPLHVADATKAFAASSILLSTTPERPSGGPFDIAKLGIVPRADQTFSRSESLWYAGEVANPSDPRAVTIDVQLRSGTKIVGTSRIALENEPVGPRRYFFARELPLASFEPGDYTMYVTIRDAGAAEVRRADFRLLP